MAIIRLLAVNGNLGWLLGNRMAANLFRIVLDAANRVELLTLQLENLDNL